MKRLLKICLILLLVGVVLAAVGAGVYFGSVWGLAYWKGKNRPKFRQAEVTRGEIVAVVNATGTIQPVLRVRIGSFVSGPIDVFVDYNDPVIGKPPEEETDGRLDKEAPLETVGKAAVYTAVYADEDADEGVDGAETSPKPEPTLLATIDPRIYKANVRRDEALLATRRAEVERVKALCQQARNDLDRAEQLRARDEDYVSDTEMDRVESNYKSFEAQCDVADASVDQALENLANSQTYLGYTKIYSPVDGIIIDRKVDPGQTLAAQFQTPELFIVAPEMTERMHVFASIDETDIGRIREAQAAGHKVEFTVDAYPDDLFVGRIIQVRMNSTSIQNVVTYPVVVEVSPNPDLKLMPGMTANISFEVERRQDVVKIPNAALRFYPNNEEWVREQDRALLDGSDWQSDAKDKDDDRADDQQLPADEKVAANKKRNRRHVWVVEDGLLRAIEIVMGIGDNKFTELVSGDVTPEMELVTGVKKGK